MYTYTRVDNITQFPSKLLKRNLLSCHTPYRIIYPILSTRAFQYTTYIHTNLPTSRQINLYKVDSRMSQTIAPHPTPKSPDIVHVPNIHKKHIIATFRSMYLTTHLTDG